MMNKAINSTPSATLDTAFSTLEKALLASLLMVYLWVFWASFSSMASNGWNKDTFAHAPLIPLISAWLIWRKRDVLVKTPLESSRLSLLAIFISGCVWLVGIAADIAVLHQLAAMGILLLIAPLVFGLKITLALLFPIAYLLFMVPIGEELVPTLQQITADITVLALRASGIPVYISGMYIEIPSGKFEVAKACSGVRYLIAGMAVGSLYAYLNYQRLRTQLLFMLVAILVPILANGIRAYLIVLIAHLSDMKYAVGADHLVYGWVFFGMVMFLMFWIGSFWTDSVSVKKALSESTNHPNVKPLVSRTALILMTVLLFIGINYAHSRLTETNTFERLPSYNIQLDQLDEVPKSNDWVPVFIGADRKVLQSFKIESATDQNTVGVFIADYQLEYQGKELINQSNRVNVYENWTRKSEHKQTLAVNDLSLPIILTEWRHVNGTKRRTWHFYKAYGRLSNSPLEVKLMQVWNNLGGASQLSSVFALAIDYEDDARATQLLTSFMKTHWRSIEKQHQQSIPADIYTE
tara:strand:- start:10761 stop:12329 length:1569 start_codon:yes stop_codon:yes gene_type:complete